MFAMLVGKHLGISIQVGAHFNNTEKVHRLYQKEKNSVKQLFHGATHNTLILVENIMFICKNQVFHGQFLANSQVTWYMLHDIQVYTKCEKNQNPDPRTHS